MKEWTAPVRKSHGSQGFFLKSNCESESEASHDKRSLVFHVKSSVKKSVSRSSARYSDNLEGGVGMGRG